MALECKLFLRHQKTIVRLGIDRSIKLFCVSPKEMEEIKTELNRARTHSARLREEVRLMREGLEKEQQNHKKTLKELEELRSLHDTLMAKSKDDQQYMESRLKELETTIKQLEKEVSNEQSEKAVYVEETTRLRKLCDQLDEAKAQTEKDLCILKEILDKTSEENKAKTLSEYNNNVLNETVFRDDVCLISRQQGNEVVDKTPNVLPKHLSLIDNTDLEINTKSRKDDVAFSAELLDKTRKELARVTQGHEESKQRCQELEKQLEETLASLQRQRAASLHDRATSPGEPTQFEFEGKYTVHLA